MSAQNVLWRQKSDYREEPPSMKKTRILSILLAALMIVSTVFFAGCGSEDKTSSSTSTSTREIIALNMYILTEDTTTEEAADKVQMAINEILLPNHKTLLKINYLTEDMYWDAVEKAFEESDPLTNAENLPESRATVVGTEKLAFTDLIEYIFADTTTDIELSQPQIDIFVVNDYEKYNELANDGMLKGLGSYLSYDSKILNTTIHPTFMSAAKVGTETYGIPTNIGVDAGEFTYLVFNEDLLKKYGYEVKNLRVFSSIDFSNYMKAIKEGEPGIWPINEPLGIAGAESYDDVFVAINRQFNYIANDTKPIFMFNDYNTNMAAVELYGQLGYYPKAGTVGENAKYAIKVERSPELLASDSDKRWTDENGTTYVRYLFDIPRVSVDEAFSSVMCVSSTSPVPERAMEMITLFQTNAELANLLQYGIKGENYQINEITGDLSYLDDTYMMNNIVTGNTFIKYPENNDKKYLNNAIKANLSAAPSAFLGFNLELSASESSQYELIRSILLAGQKAVENGAKFDDVRKMVNRELILLGYEYVSTTDLAGIYGRVQLSQRALADPIAKNFGLGDEIIRYNEPYGVVLEKRVEKKAEETAEGEEGAEGEEAEGEEASEGEEIAEGEEAAE